MMKMIKLKKVICFLPNTSICNQIRKLIVSDTKFSKSKTPIKKIIILKTFLKQNEDLENFTERIAKDYEYCKSKEQKNECIYFLPLVISGVTDKVINSIVSEKFPPELKGINKLIFGTTFLESLDIEDVSVVVDSGLFEDLIFNPNNGITSSVQKTCSEASMSLRKGRLGLTMNGLYCTFSKYVKDDNNHEPDLLERDITNNFLSMKRINIDFENLTNLPYKAKKENLDYSINLLTQYGLINNDDENENGVKPLEMNDFDINELGLDFSIPFYYIAAIIKFSKSFTDENDRNYAYLFASYISLIILNSRKLIKDEISEKLAEYHDEKSDIVTLFRALNDLLCIKNSERNKAAHNQQSSNKKPNERAHNKSTSNQPNSNEKAHNESISNQPNSNEKTHNKSTSNQPNSDERARNESTSNQPNSNEKAHNESASNQPNSNEKERNRSTSNQPNSNEKERNRSTSNQPNSNEKERNRSTSNQPNSNEKARNKSTSNQSRPKQQRFRGSNFKRPKSKRENIEDERKDELNRCFSYQEVSKLTDKMKTIVRYLFGDADFYNIFQGMKEFANKKGIYEIIDKFIDKIEIKLNNEAENKWEKIHSFNFQGIRNIKTDRNPELIFLGADELKVNENQQQGKIFIIKRPGMKGLTTPSQIYCFNIECKIENDNYKKLIGHIIHQKRPCKIVNTAIEIDSTTVLNPWFNVLLDIYFNRNNDNKKVKFYYTTLGEKVFLSFNNDNYSLDEIKMGVQKCFDIFPYTPRSVLIYRSDLDVVVQVRSLGSNDYISEDSTNCYCEILNRELIDQLCTDIDDLLLSYPLRTICSLFINETCKNNELDRDNLYVVTNKYINDKQNVIKFVKNKTSQMKNKMKQSVKSNAKEGLFQFPKKLVHPSLVYCKAPKASLLNWLKKYWDSAHGNTNNNNDNDDNNKGPKKKFEVVGHKFKMSLFEIQKLQDYLFLNDENKIKKEMDLQYEAISFPVELQKNIDRNNEKWHVNKKFNTIIAPIEDLEEVKKFIEDEKEKYNQNNHSLLLENKVDPVYCIYACDQQELTEFPLTIKLKNGVGPLKICKYCIMDSLKTALQGLYSDGINTGALKMINTKPECVLNIPSEIYIHYALRYPLIPIGQLVLVLFNFRDDELSSLASGFLQTICEFTIRFRMKGVFTFCPNHPQKIYRVKDYPNQEIKCCDNTCDYFYCHKCHLMHNKTFDCTIRQLPTGEKLCPNCNTPIKKDGGCNTIICRCGTEFCYQCGLELTTDVVAGLHLINGHRNSQYSFDNENID